jgi:hypothetical protein
MSWTPVSTQRGKSWNRSEGYELRLTNHNIGYLNANAREFLFDGKRAGQIAFENESDSGGMSIVTVEKGLKVNQHGHLAVSTITSQTTAPLPITVLLVPFEDEKRLLFGGIRK